MEGVPAERIAAAAGTPVYVYSSAAMRERFLALDRAFAGRPRLLCYALKANPNRAVCRLFAGLGAGADVVSGGELRRAMEAGFNPGSIVFSGVGKSAGELAAAVRARILSINVESAEELAAVEAAARRAGRRTSVSVRLTPGVDAGGHRHVSTGGPETKFGVERGEALRLYRRAAASRWLSPAGVHCHIGSQVLDAAAYRRAAGALAGLIRTLRGMGIEPGFADIGGGMGVRYKDERPPSPAALASALASLLESRPSPRLLLEPGRFLTADAGVLLTKVLYRKRTSRRRFVVVDAGMNDLLRPALYGAWHGIVPARLDRGASGRRGPACGRRVRLDVVGPVCETADRLAEGRLMPWPGPGDLWAVLDAGAYGFSMASQYNSRPRPAEVLVEGGKWRVVRRRESFEDLVRGEA